MPPHMSIVEPDNGGGPPSATGPTMRFMGVNVQRVNNRRGATDRDPADPSVSATSGQSSVCGLSSHTWGCTASSLPPTAIVNSFSVNSILPGFFSDIGFSFPFADFRNWMVGTPTL
jgi:hypothetical protein